MSIIRFEVSMPSEEGYIGRSCNNPNCGKYFKIQAESIRDAMYCPYCGNQFSKNELLTEDQEAHVRAQVVEKGKEYILGEFDKMLARSSRRTATNKHFKVIHKSKPYKAKSISPAFTTRHEQ